MSKHPNSTPLNTVFTVFYKPKSKIQNQKSSDFQPRVHGVPYKICAGCANFRKLTAEAQRARSKKLFLVKIHSELCELRVSAVKSFFFGLRLCRARPFVVIFPP